MAMEMTAGQKMEDARLQAKLTRKSAAEEIGVTYQSIWLWENDRKVPNAANLATLVDVYRDHGVWLTMDEVMYA